MARVLIGSVAVGLLVLCGCGKGSGTAPVSVTATRPASVADRVLGHYVALGGPDLKTRVSEVDPWLKAHADAVKALEPECGQLRTEPQGTRPFGQADALCAGVLSAGMGRSFDESLKNYDHLSFGGKK